jgi:hypothetical protein
MLIAGLARRSTRRRVCVRKSRRQLRPARHRGRRRTRACARSRVQAALQMEAQSARRGHVLAASADASLAQARAGAAHRRFRRALGRTAVRERFDVAAANVWTYQEWRVADARPRTIASLSRSQIGWRNDWARRTGTEGCRQPPRLGSAISATTERQGVWAEHVHGSAAGARVEHGQRSADGATNNERVVGAVASPFRTLSAHQRAITGATGGRRRRVPRCASPPVAG